MSDQSMGEFLRQQIDNAREQEAANTARSQRDLSLERQQRAEAEQGWQQALSDLEAASKETADFLKAEGYEPSRHLQILDEFKPAGIFLGSRIKSHWIPAWIVTEREVSHGDGGGTWQMTSWSTIEGTAIDLDGGLYSFSSENDEPLGTNRLKPTNRIQDGNGSAHDKITELIRHGMQQPEMALPYWRSRLGEMVVRTVKSADR